MSHLADKDAIQQAIWFEPGQATAAMAAELADFDAAGVEIMRNNIRMI